MSSATESSENVTMRIVTTLVFLHVGGPWFALGHKYYQIEIPNGEIVPHPCKPNFIWHGVGHANPMGGGEKNSFGEAFQANNYKWTKDLCIQDSDGDGMKNGEELGDPGCVWIPGAEPTTKEGLSHPGICDPYDSPECAGRTDFVNCAYKEFDCEHVNDADVFNFTINVSDYPVPSDATSYMCLVFEFPEDQAYHIIADRPALDNMNVIHHMMTYGVCNYIGHPPELNKLYPCELADVTAGQGVTCLDMFSGWLLSEVGNCYPSEAGVLVGGGNGYKYGILQYHWNNPQKRADYVDSSGMTFYATPKLRPYNAAMLTIGQAAMIIPPGIERHEEYGACSPRCTAKYMPGNITIFIVNNHMHYLGREQRTKVIYKDGSSVDIGTDDPYSYDNPSTHRFPEGVVVSPGDELATTCVYQSTSRTGPTYSGKDTHDEMCMAFIMFYPSENFHNKKRCYKMASIDVCEIQTGYVDGCDIPSLYSPHNQEPQLIMNTVNDLCVPNECRQECLEYVRDVKKQPCFHGDISKAIRFFEVSWVHDPRSWYAALDSCDIELAEELNM